jgi:hypothetical protein
MFAFPLPDLKVDLDDDITAFPLESRSDDPNFLGFSVLQRHLERRATQERTRCREAA